MRISRLGSGSVNLLVLSLLLLVLLARVAQSQEIRYLSLDGDGTAALVVDKAASLALIADGGRQGKSGVAGARIGNFDVLDYLREQTIQKLVISCSHPHKDHMGGLISMVSDERIKQFDVTFVAVEYQASLAEAYTRTTGREAKFVAALGTNGMSEATASARSLKIRNFVYDPATVGADVHDASMIVEYDIGSSDKLMRLVDFDDASEKLLAVWAKDPASRVDTVVIPHHGSRNNKITVLLDDIQRYGLKNAIIPVNRGNRYRHPAPEVLLALIERLGPDHVFVTGADATGVVIGKDGAIDPDIVARNRGKLGDFIDAQIDQRQAEAKQVLNGESAHELRRTATTLDADDVAAFKAAVAADSEIDTADGRRFTRILTDIENLQAARSEVRGSQRKHVLALLLSGQGPGESPTPRPNGIDPRPDLPNRPGHGAYKEKLAEARTVHARLSSENGSGSASSESPGGDGGGGGGVDGSGSGGRGKGGGGGGSFFRSMLRSPHPVWGGVILGNEASGPAVTGLEFIATGADEEGSQLNYSLVFTLEGGELAEYGGVTPLELWAAYNVVQPTAALTSTLDFELPPNAAGIAGMTNIDIDNWEFALHPAVANSALAVDAMRLDMLLSVAQSFAMFRPNELPAYLSELSLEKLQYDTYQWYDDPAEISAANGYLRVRAATEPRGCLMRVRLVQENYPEWFDSSGRTASVVSRVSELVPAADTDRIKELLREDFVFPQSDDPAIKAAISQVIEELQSAAPLQNLSLNERLEETCEAFPSLVAMDRLARVVALLNWYSRHGAGALPPLPASLAFPERMSVAPELDEASVFGRSPPLGPRWLIVLLSAITILLVLTFLWLMYRGVRWTWRRLRA